jgi:phage tail P2-like protein
MTVDTERKRRGAAGIPGVPIAPKPDGKIDRADRQQISGVYPGITLAWEAWRQMGVGLLPPNATPQEIALEATTARLGVVPVPIKSLWDPETCPVSLLPWLAWALSVDYWDPGWDEAIKRQVVAESMEYHRRKGTPWAVEHALLRAGAGNPEIIEWFDYGGDAYRFKVRIEGPVPTEADRKRYYTVINASKNARSWLDALINRNKEDLEYYRATVIRYRAKLTIEAET